MPLEYKGIKLDCGYRMDMVVENKVVLELKCVEKVVAVHEAQMLTYLRLSKIKTGLILNFYTGVKGWHQETCLVTLCLRAAVVNLSAKKFFYQDMNFFFRYCI